MAEQISKTKKKRWFTIVSPKLLGERPVGESYIAEPNALIGRVIPCNLMVITGDIKHQSITIKLEIKSIKDNKAFTDQISYELSPTQIKRLMRRRKNRIDDSFSAKTKDSQIVRLKLFAVTNSRTKSSVLIALRKKLNEVIKDIVSKNSYDDIYDGVIRKGLQRDIAKSVSKIYPIKILEIKALKRVSKEKKEEKEEVKKEIKEGKKEPEKEKKEKDKKEEPPKGKEEKPEKKAKKTQKKETKKKNAKASN